MADLNPLCAEGIHDTVVQEDHPRLRDFYVCKRCGGKWPLKGGPGERLEDGETVALPPLEA